MSSSRKRGHSPTVLPAHHATQQVSFSVSEDFLKAEAIRVARWLQIHERRLEDGAMGLQLGQGRRKLTTAFASLSQGKGTASRARALSLSLSLSPSRSLMGRKEGETQVRESSAQNTTICLSV